MIQWHEEIKDKFHNHKLPISNKKLKLAVEKFSFHYVSEKNDLNQSSDIINKINESKIMIINSFKETDLTYFIIVSEQTIILFHQSSISFLKNIFSNISELKICFYPKTKDFFDKNIKIKYIELKNIFDLNCFNLYITKIKDNKLLRPILTYIFQYLIQKSYHKLSIKNRMKDFNQNPEQPKIYEEEDYIELGLIASGSSFCSKKIYLIEKEEILVIKQPKENDPDIDRLKMRELENYEKFKHPFLTKFYGKTQNTNYVIIEYINGQTLLNTQMNELTEKDKITIIFEVMLTISHFHKIKMILRDLKPNNIMIDHNKTVVFIDFDRAVNFDDIEKIKDKTSDLSSIYAAPEISNKKNISYKNDIFSLGKIIEFMKFNEFDKNSTLKNIYENCIDEDPSKRRNIFDIINIFFETFYESLNDINDLINIYIEFDIYLNNSEKYFNFGNLLYKCKNDPYNINKAIHYFKLAADLNHPKAQYNLGLIYYEGKYFKKDIQKAINYFKIAADQNLPEAQFKLGFIYYEGKYVNRDIEKTIHYYELAAKQNHTNAIYSLGALYYKGNYVKKDITKAINYFKLAANQNCPDANYVLGLIYFEGIYVKKDIQTAIKYFIIAADQKQITALLIMGDFYYTGQYVKSNINKSIKYLTEAAKLNSSEAQYYLGNIYEEYQEIDKMIYYFSLAADQNNAEAQFSLAATYDEGKYIKRDINKAIHYYELAAIQNHPKALNNLGLIYLMGQYRKSDINKAIDYFNRSSIQNFPNAQRSLGSIYYSNQYVDRDIEKAIYYYILAANNNDLEAQYYLGKIYYLNEDGQRDIRKSIYYYELAANQNHSKAQNDLAIIYYENKCIKEAIFYFTLAAKQNNVDSQFRLGLLYEELNLIDNAIYYYKLAAYQNHSNAQYNLGLIYFQKNDIKNAIEYYTLAANQNNPKAQFNLGSIYLLKKYKHFDINKALFYYTLASQNNHSNAQNNLGFIYLEGKYVVQRIDKSFYYFQLAANQNNPNAQLMLGIFYILGFYVEKNFDKGLNLLEQSLENCKNINNYFIIGFCYHDKDIEKSIKYYSEASTLNCQYARNNLGIIYKNGFGIVEKNIGIAINYFRDSIKKDKISMYNLAHTYIYEDKNNNRINDSITLLIKSFNDDFEPAKDLLCIGLIKKCGFDINKITNVLLNDMKQTNYFASNICQKIQNERLLNKNFYDEKFNYYKTIDFLYDIFKKPILSTKLQMQKSNNIIINSKIKNITSEFYEGFGF